MPSHLSADRPAGRSPSGDSPVEALIARTRQLRTDMDAVRRDTESNGTDPQDRWQRALYDLALHHLEDLDEHLAQLREGPPPAAGSPEALPASPAAPGAGPAPAPGRIGSAEWELLTDEVRWSAEFYEILGMDPTAHALTLDELPSLVLDEDRPRLTVMVTDCLVDGRPIDGEFRITRPDDGRVRTVHMKGEPVLDADGNTASMWAVLRDVSELRRHRRAVSETRDSLRRGRPARSGQGLVVEPQEAVLPPWHGSLRLPRQGGPGSLELAARRLPSSEPGGPAGGDWYDACELPDGETLIAFGTLAGEPSAVASGTTMLIGALRGMAMAGAPPGRAAVWLDDLLRGSALPVSGPALCCRYRTGTMTLRWSGCPAPVLFRDGTGRTLHSPGGQAEAEQRLEAGDLLVLHTAGLVIGAEGEHRLTALAGSLQGEPSAQGAAQVLADEFGDDRGRGTGSFLVARVHD
ncbi:PP2C family protein-serine/threonine phosphatase [Streptomyces abyssomicinicus]|uniref:PP2C family protein-serine/threonine phosphatase n=1 Tax=Streptomyces abyssomicinicus TaxID=574929 RepID=UPI0012508D47|nr:PAS domain-containing protein [Streptomyces abyssomicinicus]